MIRILCGTVSAVCLSVCGCASRITADHNREALYEGVDYKSFVRVAAIDPKKAEHVTKLLETEGIPNIVEGSTVYGVSVPPEKRSKAIELLKADAEKEKYYIKF